VIWVGRTAALVVLATIVGLALGALARQEPVAEPTPGAAIAAPSATPRPSATRAALIAREVLVTPVPPTVTPTPLGAPATVVVVDFGFQPYETMVHVGQRVTWHNQSVSGHDVTAGGASPWRSGPLEPAATFTQQFAAAGVYDYQCTIHPEMRGRVVVLA
jgi:plastocyanin